MVLFEDKNKIKKYIFTLSCIGLYSLLCLYLIFMALEFINDLKRNYDILSDFDFVEYKFSLILYGDTTPWFHTDLYIKYKIYILLYAIQSILSFIIYRFVKSKKYLIIISIWLILFIISFVGEEIVLGYFQDGFLPLPYYKRFIMMQFLRFGNIYSRLIYIFIYIFFIAIHILGLKNIINYYKNR